MGCGSGRCGTGSDGTAGCNNGCSTGGCNKLNTHDWLADITIGNPTDRFNIVEVSFKNGARKGFYRNSKNVNCITGDQVIVESKFGQDLGRITLSGELVRLQMNKKKVKANSEEIYKILRVATEQDLRKAKAAWAMEQNTMLMARVIARDLKLDMKIGDVEFQGDGRKATFYYIADGRVDFRELIKLFAREFQVKIEMRQIGARAEAARIGGIGSCGRELCCSTWLTQYKSVNTTVARYQNLAINQAKLSGQCGRLKCCLNYELDSYLDALQEFPKKADYLYTEAGKHKLIKTDIFKRKLWYALPETGLKEVGLDRVKEVLELNRKGINPPELVEEVLEVEEELSTIKIEYADEITLPDLPKEKRRRRGGRNRRDNRRGKGNDSGNTPNDSNKPQQKTDNSGQKSGGDNKARKPQNRNRNRNRNRNKGGENNQNNNDKKA